MKFRQHATSQEINSRIFFATLYRSRYPDTHDIVTNDI